MSSDRPAGDPSRAADEGFPSQASAEARPDATAAGAAPAGRADASLVRVRGLPLLEALAAHSPGAREHADAVAAYAFATAVELGLDRELCELIREVARLHDVGLVYLPSALAEAPRSGLLPGERAELERHPAAGAALARGAGVPEQACEWILAVGERYDGLGPRGVAGTDVPLASRVARAACAYDRAGVTASGPRRWRGESRALAISHLLRAAGAELDPSVVDALARVVTRAATSAHG
jgi:HD-GYP domain-containing protein (c-di-GMP phosphodiesterase class II)